MVSVTVQYCSMALSLIFLWMSSRKLIVSLRYPAGVAVQGAEAESFSQYQCVGTVGRQRTQRAGRESAADRTNKNIAVPCETTV